MSSTLADLADEDLLPVARAFNQFLNLANMAEQYQLIRRRDADQSEPFEARVLPELLARLKQAGHGNDALARQLAKLDIQLVLTAHPTEVARRTLIQKYDAIAAQLAAQDHREAVRRAIGAPWLPSPIKPHCSKGELFSMPVILQRFDRTPAIDDQNIAGVEL